MQKYLRELRPTVFEDLIAMNALYRPGPMDYIPSFIARKNGKEPITYDIPCICLLYTSGSPASRRLHRRVLRSRLLHARRDGTYAPRNVDTIFAGDASFMRCMTRSIFSSSSRFSP